MDEELTSIVENNTYVRARALAPREARSKKWRSMLQFPNITDCEVLQQRLEENQELTFGAIAKQPIGKRLLELCFESQKEPRILMSFISAVQEYAELVFGEIQKQAARDIMKTYGSKGSPTYVQYLESIGSINFDTLTPSTFLLPVQKSVEQLSGAPFTLFRESNYFKRFLQWKMLELQKVEEQQFRIYRVLGKGAFGTVHAAHRLDTGKMYAIKVFIKRRLIRADSLKHIMNERNFLERVSSPFVIGLTYAYATAEHLGLVLTLMSCGDLRFHIKELGVFKSDRARFYAAEMVLGLQHLHSLRLVYRDMKPENILMDERGHIRISDLGLATEIPIGKMARGQAGTKGYIPPEMYEGKKYSFPVDWWSLGCVIFEMLCGYSPFHPESGSVDEVVIQARTTASEPMFTEHIKMLPEDRDIIRRLLHKNPKERLGSARHGHDSNAEDVKSHEFFAYINWGHLLAGNVKPPFVPSQDLVYAKDSHHFYADTLAHGIKIKPEHETLFSTFEGIASYNWEKDILETVFDELNPFTTSSSDLRPPVEEKESCLSACLFPKPPRPSFDPVVFDTAIRMRNTRKKASVMFNVYNVRVSADENDPCDEVGAEARVDDLVLESPRTMDVNEEEDDHVDGQQNAAIDIDLATQFVKEQRESQHKILEPPSLCRRDSIV